MAKKLSLLVATLIVVVNLFLVAPVAAQGGCSEGTSMPGTVFVCQGGRWTIGMPLVQKTGVFSAPTLTPTTNPWPAPKPVKTEAIYSSDGRQKLGDATWFKLPRGSKELFVVGPLGTAIAVAAVEPTQIGKVILVGGAGVLLIYSTINTFQPSQRVYGESGVRSYVSALQAKILQSSWTLAPTLQANVWFSLNHDESQRVIAGLLATCPPKQIIRKGDGRSSGSVQIWAGVKEKTMMATVGGVHIVGPYVDYFALQVPVRIGPFPGFDRLGQSAYYYARSSVKWACAWRISRTVGHEAHGEPELLTVGQGLQKWEETKVKYGLTIPLVVLYLP